MKLRAVLLGLIEVERGALEIQQKRADAMVQLADMFGNGGSADLTVQRSLAPRRPRRKARRSVAMPQNKPSDTEMAKARRILRNMGMVPSKGPR